ncbi:helix-turn-helix domain-containing protein [Maribacter litoralis]|jgi:DNA-binding Xre family transcriptional regulator|uniref:helix-turn-helix domain-containing protein n=1 Tax=Maribacter litoralis TaxID=2059726 RepID=UPI0013E0A70D|nr:helix-turn-helix domain-containing protein [Maribacter litoralis]
MSEIKMEICNFIPREWLLPWLNEGQSQSSLANNHNIDESTFRKIKSKNGYRIPVETLNKICEAKNLKLCEFFQKVGV